MVWKKRAWTAGALLLCTSVLLAAAKPGEDAKSEAERAQILSDLAQQSVLTAAGTQPDGSASTPSVTEDKRQEVAIEVDQFDLLRERLEKARATDDPELVARLKAELEEWLADPDADLRGPATCASCSVVESDADLDPIPTTLWGGTIAGDCGVNGHWMAVFTAAANEKIHFDLCTIGSGNFDADIKILSSACAIITGVDGNSTCGWRPSNFVFTAPSAGTYYAVIAPFRSYNQFLCAGTAANTFTLAYYSEGVTVPPANDDCAGAFVVTNGFPAATGDNCNAGADLVEATCQSNSNQDVWYEYTATCTGTVTMSTEGSSQSDTVLSVYDACSNGVQVACDDDAGTGLLSLLSFDAIAGTTYQVRVASFSTGCGGYNLNISCAEAPQGACCDGGACTIDHQLTCEAGGGSYLGDGTDCTGNPCAEGACCFNDGSCSVLTSDDCATSNGVYSGDGSNCSPNLCPQPCTCDVTTGGFCTPFGDDVAGSFGLWTNSTDDNLDWTLLKGATSSSGTGPSADHTTGNGYYAYIESSSPAVTGDIAILDAPCVDLSVFTNPAVSFFYHMFGPGMGTLELQVSGDNCLSWDTVWSEAGNQGNAWLFAQVDLSAYAGQTIHARFVGTVGPIPGGGGFSFESDMALDDICFDEFQVFDGGCCDLDTGNCLGFMDEATCLGSGNTTWHIQSDCSVNNFCPQPPPENDLCANATVIPSVPYADLNVNYGAATPDIDITCNSSSCTETNYGVWYTYTPVDDCQVRIVVAGSTTFQDTATAIFSGADCSSLTQVACSDPETMTFDLTGGVTYWILVGRWSCSSTPTSNLDISVDCINGACCTNGFCSIETPNSCAALGGTYVGDGVDCSSDPCAMGACCIGASCQELSETDCLLAGGAYQGSGTTCATSVCNDDCDDAFSVGDGTPAATGNNCAAGPDLVEAGCQSNSNKDVWYEYTATCTGTVTMSTEGSSQSDTVLSVYDACSNGVQVACDDDAGTGLLSLLSFDAIAGTTYQVRVASFSTGCGGYNLNISCAEAPQGACCDGGACTIDHQLTCEAGGGVYGGDYTICAGSDCNGNGSDDACEILEDPTLDCNANAVPDDCDIAGATSNDCDGNALPDECDPDCNGNGIVDGCDISCGADCAVCYPGACGTIDDCQPDGIPDDCQLGAGARAVEYLWDDGTLENSIGIPAGADILALNHFTIQEGAESIVSVAVAWGDVPIGNAATVYVWSDPNGDGNPADAQVLSSAAVTIANPADNTYEVYPVPPVTPGGAGTSFFVGFLHASTGTDQFPLGIDESPPIADQAWIVGDTGFSIDPNNVGSGSYSIPLAKLTTAGFAANAMIRANGEASGADCNTNGVPDECDIRDCADPLNDPNCSDCDGNGVIDGCEFVDCNENGTHDACDIAQGADDCDLNGVPDKCDPDCDGNDIPDACEPDQSDCNNNGTIDLCDIANGASNDCQPDGVPDECQLNAVPKVVVLTEGFEGALFPPAGWSEVIFNAGFNWKLETATAGEGVQSADVEYDPSLAPQDEWLLTPALQMSGTVTVSGMTMGSWYWGGGAPFDNYDVEMWAVVNGVGGGDDVFIALLDNDWPASPTPNFTWANFSHSFTAPSDPFQIGFYYTGSDGAQAGIDAIVVDGTPDTGPPANDCDEDGVPDDCQLCGDLNRDGDVDAGDYQAFLAAYAKAEGDPGYVYCFDFNGDGVIGLTDYRAWLECYRAYVGNPLAGPPVIRQVQLQQGPTTTQTAPISRQ